VENNPYLQVSARFTNLGAGPRELFASDSALEGERNSRRTSKMSKALARPGVAKKGADQLFKDNTHIFERIAYQQN